MWCLAQDVRAVVDTVEVDWLTSLPCHSPWGGGVRPTIAANVANASMCDIITSYRALFQVGQMSASGT
jgi:hypothetical protein